MGQGTAGLAERLAGKHVLLTGVTGFVGEALLQLLLTQVPGVRTTVLVRPKGSTSGSDRVRALLKKPTFASVAGDDEQAERLLAERLAVLEGDLTALPDFPSDIDAVVHSAGDVSFDPLVDEGFTTNVVGTRQMLEKVAAVGPHVHYVHISTAYVSGRRRGTILEGPVQHDADVETELAWGLSQRTAVENASRSPDVLAKERSRSEREHGRAGPITVASATEERRKDWVRKRLIEIGSERARSLGWTDCYTFTKALGERVVEAYAAQAPVSIVRPSIIESALEKPHPGWIEGFKMAEPLILAYGRGELPEFPAAGDTIVDIVPVDHVVAAIVAVLGRTPEPGRAEYFHVSSGARNPLTFTHLYDAVRRYFDLHPFEFGERGAARLPEWRFPGARAVEQLLTTSERAHKAANYLVSRAPRGTRTRDLVTRLDRQGRRLEFLRRYIDLYREYTQIELRFDDTNTLELFHSLSREDRERFAFDTAVVDWDHYLTDVHCPSVTAPVRQFDEVRKKRGRPDTGTLRAVATAKDDAPKAAAFFDMDGTLLSSNVVETYLWMRLHDLDGTDRAGELARIGGKLPQLVLAERRERGEFLRSMYREYAGARLEDLDAIVDEALADHVLSRLSAAALRRIREHRRAGQPTVLITGAIRPLTRPLAPLFDHIEAADLAVDNRGICTGFLASSPLVGESRAAWMRSYAAANGIDLTSSYAYADSHSDLPLLEAVGRPTVISPDVSLYRHARKKRWTIVDWASSEANGRSLTPGARP